VCTIRYHRIPHCTTNELIKLLGVPTTSR
jgi:hypothetical protein